MKVAQKLGLTSHRFSNSAMSERAREETEEAKLSHRSELNLDDWRRHCLYKDDWCDSMMENPPKSILQVAYENYDDLNVDDFRQKYEVPNIPLVIKGATRKWPAKNRWSFEVT